MKSKCSLLLALFLAGAMCSQAQPKTEENVKKYHQSWEAAGVGTLEVINKFGEVKVNNSSSPQVTVDVVITVDTENESAARELLDDITIGFSKSGNTVKAETTIKDSSKTRKKFSIDYSVNIPSDKNLNITNKFGNTFINELNAKGNFNIGYGNINANKLLGPASGGISLNLEYGKGDIGEMGDATINVSYSKLFIDKGKNFILNSKYSGIKLGKAIEVKTDSKYDGFEVDEIESLVAEMKYTSVKIGKLHKKFILTTAYGGIKVEDIASSFKQIEITNSFGQVSLGLKSDASYNVRAECEFCVIKYPQSEFKGNSEKSDFTKKIDGVIGVSPKGKISVKSRYGNINLGN